MNKYANSYDAIVSTTFFQRAGPQEDPGLEILPQIELFQHNGVIYRREIIRAILGDEAHIWEPGGRELSQLSLNPSNINYLRRESVGAIAMLTDDKKLSLVCIAPLEVEDDTAPNDEHYDKVFFPTHRIIFSYKDGHYEGKLLFEKHYSPQQLMNPRVWDLSTGKKYEENEINDDLFLACLNTVSLEQIIAKFPALKPVTF
jgi:hypothetical protein